MPLLAGGLLELPLGLLAGEGERRRLAVLGGGVIFVLTLLAAASARSFAVLLCAFVASYPASGAFVSLTQAELMDTWPDRHAQVMARWEVAGSAGAVAGPLLLTAVLAAGGGWRDAYLVLAVLAAVTWLASCARGPRPGPVVAPDTETAGVADRGPRTARAREVLAALRNWDTLRWLVLLQVADLLVDVFTGFLALYLVDAGHLRPAIAALAMAIRLGAALGGGAALVVVLERATDLAVLRVTAVAAALLYPGFLLAPGVVAKLVILAALMPRHDAVVPAAAGPPVREPAGPQSGGGDAEQCRWAGRRVGPLAVGLAAQRFGLPWSPAGLVVVPVVILAVSAAARPAAAATGPARDVPEILLAIERIVTGPGAAGHLAADPLVVVEDALEPALALGQAG